MRCVASCGSISFPWLVFIFGALLWGSIIHKHTGRCMWQRSASDVFLELREIILSFQTGLNLVNAAVVCAILESMSGLEPSSVITQPRYLKLVTVSSFSPFTLISVLMPLVLFVISLVFSALISTPQAVEALSRHPINFASSSSSPAKPSMSSAKRRLVIVLPPKLTVHSWSSRASLVILSRNTLKTVGESRHPCRTPTVVLAMGRFLGPIQEGIRRFRPPRVSRLWMK